jgi:hypothetical protein
VKETYIDDDIAALVELGFLRLDRNATGRKVLVMTRAASEFVRSLPRPMAQES